jgi:hypothetical protein
MPGLGEIGDTGIGSAADDALSDTSEGSQQFEATAFWRSDYQAGAAVGIRRAVHLERASGQPDGIWDVRTSHRAAMEPFLGGYPGSVLIHDVFNCRPEQVENNARCDLRILGSEVMFDRLGRAAVAAE